jgi:hypothetical protein
MSGRIAISVLLALLAFAPAAQAEDFSLTHSHSGSVDASAEGSVTFPETGAHVSVTVTDRNEDGWCAQAWVKSNLPPATHKSYQRCGVATQQTWTLDLPAGERCNVTFVEVIVGRVDPSEGNKTELGQTKRIANPCPPVPVPAPVQPPPPPRINSLVSHDWTVRRHRTRNNRLLVRDVPAGASVELRCSRQCPRKRAVPVRNGRANVHRLLGKRRLRSGTRVEVRITAPNMVGALVRFRMRKKKLPSWRRYCLPVRTTSAQRC